MLFLPANLSLIIMEDQGGRGRERSPPAGSGGDLARQQQKHSNRPHRDRTTLRTGTADPRAAAAALPTPQPAAAALHGPQPTALPNEPNKVVLLMLFYLCSLNE